jgi:hypothetical protein
LIGAFLAVLWAQDAYAYLDPGTGSMILQAIIGAVAMGYVIIRQWWTSIAAFFRRLTGRPRAAGAQGKEGDSKLDGDG